MRLARDRICDLVIQCLRKYREKDGRAVPITEKTNPIKLFALESLDDLDFACTLSNKLKFHIPDNINPLVDDKKKRARKVEEIVDLIEHLMIKEEEKEEEDNA